MLVITPALSIFNCLQRTSFTGVLPDSIWLTNYNYLHITLLHEPWKRILAEAIWISDRNSVGILHNFVRIPRFFNRNYWRISLPPEKFQPEKLKLFAIYLVFLKYLFRSSSKISNSGRKSSWLPLFWSYFSCRYCMCHLFPQC